MRRVLIAPLDWGLGHATRCIPIVRELLKRKCEVTLAGSGASLELLRAEFPELEYLVLPGYRPVYPMGRSMVWKMARQLPKFLSTIRKERSVIESVVRKRAIDILISDNRYGARSEKVKSVFITHQSNVLMPQRFGWMQSSVRRVSHELMSKFFTCWIPDYPDGLAAALVSFGKVPANVNAEYVGPLSRFTYVPGIPTSRDVLAVFSGPEPQRTIFENRVVSQLEKSTLMYAVARGLPGHGAKNDGPVFDFATSGDLQTLMASASIVIARSGYSTIMDLMAMRKNAILVPTPGQTEQEHLARRLRERGVVYTVSQDNFDLKRSLAEAEKFPGFEGDAVFNNGLLSQAMDRLLA